MKIYTHISSGEFHPIHGEDFLYHQHIGENLFIGAVMDGCSSGKESYFASTAYGKSLRKSCRMLPNMKEIIPDFDIDFMEKEAIGAFILNQLFDDLKKLKKTFFLNIEELLSTMILMVFDLKDNSAWVNISGDGMVVCNGKVTEIDQNNVPDYLSYHFDLKFDDWYSKHTQTLEFNGIYDISISSDGISKIYRKSNSLKKDIDPVNLLLIQKPKGDSGDAIDSQFNQLLENGYISADDMSIIRLVL